MAIAGADQQGNRPRVEVLYVDGCPHYPAVLALVERSARSLASRPSWAPPWSATRKPPSGSAPSLACRLYRHEQGLSGQPAEGWVRDALLAAAGSGDAAAAEEDA
jgi:hypothetical protein